MAARTSTYLSVVTDSFTDPGHGSRQRRTAVGVPVEIRVIGSVAVKPSDAATDEGAATATA